MIYLGAAFLTLIGITVWGVSCWIGIQVGNWIYARWEARSSRNQTVAEIIVSEERR